MPFLNHVLYSVYQPILDIKRQRAIGAEALIRSQDGIAPDGLFSEAEWRGNRLELDRYCRESAMRDFRSIDGCGQDMLLFMNVDIASLDDAAATQGWIIDRVEEHGLAARQIALEIVESGVENNDKLIDFVSRHREAGFLVVLDDFGYSHSNLNRIVQLKPDIIKIDKGLVRDIHRDHYKQSVVSAVIKLADAVGAISLAEGVEHKEEMFACCELGATLFQGYYFAMPETVENLSRSACESRMKAAMPELNEYMDAQALVEQNRQGLYQTIFSDITGALARMQAGPEVELASLIAAYPQVDAVYLLDEQGIQTSETVMWFSRPGTHPLFAPARKGTNHAYRKYFYTQKSMGGGRYLSDPYISRASGHVCRTMSSRIMCAGKDCILCVDFLYHQDDANHS